MYQHQQNSELHRLSKQQYVSLEKHRNIVDNALRWQQHSQSPAGDAQQPGSATRLRLAFATLLNIFTK